MLVLQPEMLNSYIHTDTYKCVIESGGPCTHNIVNHSPWLHIAELYRSINSMII